MIQNPRRTKTSLYTQVDSEEAGVRPDCPVPATSCQPDSLSQLDETDNKKYKKKSPAPTSRLPAIFDYCLPPSQIVIPSIVSVDNIKKRNRQSIIVVSFLFFGHSDGSNLFEAKVCKLRYENTCNFSFLVFFLLREKGV